MKENISNSDFLKEIKKVKGKRHHKFIGGYNVRDIYKAYKKECDNPLEYKTFQAIIKKLNQNIADSLMTGDQIELPQGMGRLEIHKVKTGVKLKKGEPFFHYPIDWENTLKLWYEDEEARQQKTLIRKEVPYVYKVFYNKRYAVFNNQSFTKFIPARKLKLAIKEYLLQHDTINAKVEIYYGRE